MDAVEAPTEVAVRYIVSDLIYPLVKNNQPHYRVRWKYYRMRTINLHPQTLGGRARCCGGNTATPMEQNGSSASTHGGRGGWAVQCTHVTRDPPNTTGASCFLKANSNTHFYASEGGQKMGGSDDQLMFGGADLLYAVAVLNQIADCRRRRPSESRSLSRGVPPQHYCFLVIFACAAAPAERSVLLNTAAFSTCESRH